MKTASMGLNKSKEMVMAYKKKTLNLVEFTSNIKKNNVLI